MDIISPQAIPTEIGKLINPKPVIDFGTEVEVVAIITKFNFILTVDLTL